MFVQIYIIVSFLRQYFNIIIYALHRITISLEDKCRDQLWPFFNIYYFDYVNLSFMYGQQMTFQCVIIIFTGTSHSTIAIICSSIHFDASYLYQLAVYDEYTRRSLLFAMCFRNLRIYVIIVILIEKFQCRTKLASSDDGINVVLKYFFAPIHSHQSGFIEIQLIIKYTLVKDTAACAS